MSRKKNSTDITRKVQAANISLISPGSHFGLTLKVNKYKKCLIILGLIQRLSLKTNCNEILRKGKNSQWQFIILS